MRQYKSYKFCTAVINEILIDLIIYKKTIVRIMKNNMTLYHNNDVPYLRIKGIMKIK